MKGKKIRSLKFRMIFPTVVMAAIISTVSLILFKCCFDEAFTSYMRECFQNKSFSVQGHNEFLNLVAEIIVLLGIILFISYVIIGCILSNAIGKPILYIENKAKDIINGNLDEPIEIGTNIKELRSLTDTINKLSSDLSQQEKVRKQLTSDIAHEIRTPITNVNSHLEAIIDGVWEATPERLESIKEEVERLSQIALDFGQLCSYDDKRIILKRSKVNIKTLLEYNVESFRAQMLDKDLKVVVNGDAIEVFIDKNRMAQAFVNLISNAIRYSNVGGRIEITVEENKGNVQISVADEGIGIGKQHIPYIFERLYRTDESRARATGGSGIGLTITKSIVDAHGGKIFVRSKEGQGSIFTITDL
ncbi:HAMP domain-containing sensor histidine kinase [uncultured Clostridium sp.]|uniref:sensor histidine kinase n=1 Tax=uncultured Clostridium sp. TaxID=59620 RepID=UPI002627AD16|nr:HAMP domain-containing sensor histidine kinase [uncultured Clostridium sp.]